MTTNHISGFSTQCLMQAYNEKYIYLFGKRYGWGKFAFTPIVCVFIAPRELLIDKNRDYMYIAFDYAPTRSDMEIVKTSERYHTTHFSEKISLN